MLAVPDEIVTFFPSALIVPPFAFSVVVPSTSAPVPFVSESGLNIMLNCPVVEVMLAFRFMLLWALSVSVALVPAILLISLATVMSPAWALVPPVPVLMVTLVPAFNAAWIVPVVIIEPSLVLVKSDVPLTLVSEPVDCMVISLGSINQLPPLVWTFTPFRSTFAADVSMNPPLSFEPSPRAEISPLATSVPLICPFSSVLTITWPPLVPSALITLLSANSIDLVAFRNILPPSITALSALIHPLCRTIPP